MSAHPLLTRAAAGQLPDWAGVSASRSAHMERVAELMTGWARELGLDEDAQLRWRAVGFLHDALREVSPDELRSCVPAELRGLPGPVLHGPAAAERLRAAGVTDAEVLDAVAYHTIGAPGLGRLGRALYIADFLEPGRPFLPEWRATLRARMPWELDAVTREVLGSRIRHLVEKGAELLPQTVAFWNVVASEAR